MDDYRGKIKHPLEIANDKLSQEIKQLQHDNEVLYRANCEISEVADRLREALAKADAYIVVLDASQDLYYCATRSDEAIEYEADLKSRAALEGKP